MIEPNIPPFMRSSVSAKFLSFNPVYKTIFRQCPSCNKFSLKPDIPSGIITPQIAAICKERKCTLCGYIHKENQ
jgi:hypothetical protein